MELLLAAGADVNANAGEYNGRRALQAAAAGGDWTVVNMLLDAGAQVNAEAGADGGRTVLQAAAAGGDWYAVKFLIAAEACRSGRMQV